MGRVCVTKASWLVNLLLSKNYSVNGTVRDPEDRKYGHLLKLEKASKNLKLCNADFLDYESLRVAIARCDGAFRVASPVPSSVSSNPKVRNPFFDFHLLRSENVTFFLGPNAGRIDATGRKRHPQRAKKHVTKQRSGEWFESSVVAATMNPRWEKGRIIDETCLSDNEYCTITQEIFEFSRPNSDFKKPRAKLESLGKELDSTLYLFCLHSSSAHAYNPTINASSAALLKMIRDWVGARHWNVSIT